MTTDMTNWSRSCGWYCPCHGYEFHSVVMLENHVLRTQSEDEKRKNWETLFEDKEDER